VAGYVSIHDTREAADAQAVVIQQALTPIGDADTALQDEVNAFLETASVGGMQKLKDTERWLVKNHDGSHSLFDSEADAQALSNSILAKISKEKEDARVAALEANMAGVGDYVPHQLEDGQWGIRDSGGTITVGTKEEVDTIAEAYRKHKTGDIPDPTDDNTNTFVPPGWTREDWLAYLESISGGRFFNQGGLASLGYDNGGYLDGRTDGMADMLNTTIEGKQPAALSDGEFVVPADVVGHLGNGNSDAGAEQLYAMMDRIRMDRTGTTEQGRQIDPNQYMPRGIA